MSRTSLNRLFLTYGLVLFSAVFCIMLLAGAYLYTSQKEALDRQFQLRMQLAETLLNEEVYHVANNLRILKTAFTTLEKNRSKNLLADFSHFTVTALAPRDIQFNAYFALDRSLSQSLFGRDAHLIATHRDVKYYGQPEFYLDSTFKNTIYSDPSYQEDEGEVWYHVAKKSKNIEFTSAYYDKTYMKQWLITGALGLYKKDQFVGMVGIDLLVDEINRKLSNFSNDNKMGILLFEKKSGLVLSPQSETQENFLASQKQFSTLKFSKAAEEQRFQKNFLREPRVVGLNLSPSGALYFSVYTQIPGTDWQVLIYKNFYDAIWSLQTSLIGGAILLFLTCLFLIVAWRHLRQEILFPLLDLRQLLYAMIASSWKNSRETSDRSFSQLRTYEEINSLNRLFRILMKVSLRNQRKSFCQIDEARMQSVQSSKMASLGQMAGGIAHEINNPLAIIAGKLHLLEREVLKDHFDKAKVLETVKSSQKIVFRIAKIISSLRNFSREASADSFESTSVHDIVQETLELCRQRINAAKIDLRVLPISPDLRIDCQSVPLSQVLVNLLNNSYDAIVGLEEKWIQIEVLEKNAELVQICVSDSGPGIPAEIAEKLMEPFFTTKRMGEGIGIGLSISKKIISSHAGKFYLDTAARNTLFVIELPKTQQNRKSQNPSQAEPGILQASQIQDEKFL